jgi:hypothetical protein
MCYTVRSIFHSSFLLLHKCVYSSLNCCEIQYNRDYSVRSGGWILPVMISLIKSIFYQFYWLTRSWDSVVGIATGCMLDNQVVTVQVPIRSSIFSSPCHPDQLWGPPNLLSNGYWGLLPQWERSQGVKLTTHLQCCQGQENVDLYIHSPTHLHGILFN